MTGRGPTGWGRPLVAIVVVSLLTGGLQPLTSAWAEAPAAATGTLALSGTPRLGGTLSIAEPDPAADYQWYRAGQPIAGATATTYSPVAADAGSPVWAAAQALVPAGAPVIARSGLQLVLPDWEQRVIAWDTQGVDPAAAGLTDAVAIATGRDHSLALRSDGTVTAWGANAYGQAEPPSGLTDVVAVTAGSMFSAALRSDGTVVAWGAQNNGRTSVPTGLDGVVQISSGLSHTLALKADGTVVAWGFGTSAPFTQALVPSGLAGVVAVAAGGNHSLALKADGTVVAWGYNYDGQSTPPPGLDDVVAIAGTNTASLALHTDGTLTGWGTESDGFPSGITAVAITGGEHRALALLPDGSVAGWAYSQYGTTQPPSMLRTATAIAAGDTESLALARVWTGTPSLAGTAQFGRTLVADPGDWVPGAGLTYQWLRDGVAIPGATAPRVTLTGADLGTRVSVRLVGELAGTPLGSAISEPSARVAPAPLAAARPRITGVVASGRVLTAATGQWTPQPRFSYQWLRSGKAIKGATAGRYTLTGKDVGARISVEVTGRLDHHTTRSATSAATAKVMKAGVPTVRGTRATGSTLTVSRGKWTARTRFTYQWLRDGKPIRKASGAKYRLTHADAGHRISVEVTGRRSGYATIKATSADTTRVLKVATPKVKGIREVGRLLHAEPGAWSASTSFTYRWYANGRLVQSLRSPHLWVSPSLRGQRITVTVTGRRPGFATVARTSRATGPIR